MSTNPLFHPLDGPISTLQRVGTIYWQSGTVRLFFKIALFFVIPATAILLALVYALRHFTREGFWQNLSYYVTVLGSQSLLQQSLGTIAEAAITVAVADLYLQRHARWFVCLQKASAKIVTLLLAGIVAGCAILFGYLFLYIPGLILKINFMLVTPVIVLEDELSVLSSLGRSWELVRGYKCYVFQCLLGLDIAYWLVTWILYSCLPRSDGENKPFFSFTFQLLSAIPKSAFVPAFGILKTVLYMHLMIAKEGLTEDRFATQVDQGMISEGHVPLITDQDELEVPCDNENIPTQEEDRTEQENDTTSVPPSDHSKYDSRVNGME